MIGGFREVCESGAAPAQARVGRAAGILGSMRTRIPVDQNQLSEFCRKNHIRRLAFFGSVIRDDFRPESDVDVLVEFEPGMTPGFAFFDLQDDLSQLLGRRVDLSTPSFLSRYIRNRVLNEAEVAFDAT